MVAITANRPPDSLDMFSGGTSQYAARGPAPAERRSPYSGVNIVQPPGGASSISFGGYGDSSPPPRAGGSPMYGRRSGPTPANAYSSYGGGAQARVQDHMGGKAIMHSPGGASNVSLGWNSETPGMQSQSQYPSRDQYAPGHPQQHNYSVPPQVNHQPSGPPAVHQPYPSQGDTSVGSPEPRHRRADSYGYMQDPYGGKIITQSPGGASSVNLSWGHDDAYSSPMNKARGPPRQPAANHHPGVYDSQHYPQPSAPEQRANHQMRHGERADGYGYHQDTFGGKNITQSPGGNSSVSFGWQGAGGESHQANSAPRPNHGVPAADTTSGYSSVSHGGRRQVPKPYVPSPQQQDGPSFSGLNIVNPPGGRQTFNIYG